MVSVLATPWLAYGGCGPKPHISDGFLPESTTQIVSRAAILAHTDPMRKPIRIADRTVAGADRKDWPA